MELVKISYNNPNRVTFYVARPVSPYVWHATAVGSVFVGLLIDSLVTATAVAVIGFVLLINRSRICKTYSCWVVTLNDGRRVIEPYGWPADVEAFLEQEWNRRHG